MYQHLTPTEWGILAAHIYGYQHQAVPVFKDDESHAKIGTKIEPLGLSRHFDLERPYSPQERIQIAIRTFWMEKNVRFENGVFHPNNMELGSERQMDIKREEESKRIYQGIMNWDTGILQEMLEKFGFVSERLGFASTSASSLTAQSKLGDLEAMFRAGNVTTGTFTPLVQTDEEKQAMAQLAKEQKDIADKAAAENAIKVKKAQEIADAKAKVEAEKLLKNVGTPAGAPQA